ncbi:MAG: DNA repair protein RecO [Chitinophagaceae bacterium]|nr:DNA repair protein RecO [Chitinophagaceae bacterium]
MLHKTQGIVFKTIKYSETSVVSKIYTAKFGLQSYLINGVRTAKSKTKASLLQSLSLLEMEVYHREHRNLNRIKELQPAMVFHSIPFNLIKGSVGLFMIEVLSKSIHEEESNEPLFHFIFEKIKALDEMEQVPSGYLIAFLLALSKHLGFHPHGSFNEKTPFFDLREGQFIAGGHGHPNTLDEQLSGKLSEFIRNPNTELSHGSRRLLLEAMLHYYQLHVPNFSPPRSLKVLEEVFRS